MATNRKLLHLMARFRFCRRRAAGAEWLILSHAFSRLTSRIAHAALAPPLPAKLTPLHFDHQGGLMEQSNASLQRGRQG